MTAQKWKFLNLNDAGEIVSAHDASVWRLGEWREATGRIQTCHNGFHASPNPLYALNYIKGGIVAQVEVDGACDADEDKSAHARMRIMRAWRWGADDSVRLAIYAAEHALPIYESAYPEDGRPRHAIEAARAHLEHPAADARAADAARAADDADDAADAADDAARAARAAADARAAYAAAYAARAADDADDARAAADARAADAARADAKQRIMEWMVAHIMTLPEIGVMESEAKR